MTLLLLHRRRVLVAGICLSLVFGAFAFFSQSAHPKASVSFKGIGPVSGSPTYCWLAISNTTHRWLNVFDCCELQAKTGRKGIGEWMECGSRHFDFNLRPHGEFLARLPYLGSQYSWKVDVFAEQLPHKWTEYLYDYLSTVRWTPSWLVLIADHTRKSEFCGLQYTLMCVGSDPAQAD